MARARSEIDFDIEVEYNDECQLSLSYTAACRQIGRPKSPTVAKLPQIQPGKSKIGMPSLLALLNETRLLSAISYLKPAKLRILATA